MISIRCCYLVSKKLGLYFLFSLLFALFLGYANFFSLLSSLFLLLFLPVKHRSYNRVFKISYEILRRPPPPHSPPLKRIWRIFAKLALGNSPFISRWFLPSLFYQGNSPFISRWFFFILNKRFFPPKSFLFNV